MKLYLLLYSIALYAKPFTEPHYKHEKTEMVVRNGSWSEHSSFADNSRYSISNDFANDIREVSEVGFDYEQSMEEILYEYRNYNIFRLKYAGELVSSVLMKKSKFYNIEKNIKTSVDTIEIYSVYTAKNYRGKGYAAETIRRGLRETMEWYGLPDDTVAILEVDLESDRFQVPLDTYYRMGFRHYMFCKGKSIRGNANRLKDLRMNSDIFSIKSTEEIPKNKNVLLYAFATDIINEIAVIDKGVPCVKFNEKTTMEEATRLKQMIITARA